MPPKGKGPAAAAPADDDSDDDMATAPLAGREAQWQAGVSVVKRCRKLASIRWLPGKQAEQRAKRKANAMSKEESLLRKAAHKREVRAQKAAALKEMRERQRSERAAAIIPAAASESAAVATVEPPLPQARTQVGWNVRQ